MSYDIKDKKKVLRTPAIIQGSPKFSDTIFYISW